MYGIFTLSEQIGESPLHFWVDVPATKHYRTYVLTKTIAHGEPSVEYRGIFINDEAPAFTSWRAKHGDSDDYAFNARLYKHVFDLLIRLKANFLWPAMWESTITNPGRVFSTDDPRNQQAASSPDIKGIETVHKRDASISGDLTWEVQLSPDAPKITLNGTVQQLYVQLLELNSNYEVE
ncbi:uncharacterized protein BDV17DRAFT_286618 [Aspergillus undulatus]|uniref:uncharacterized protein n=1 Tax=Aspergillus undulatus TaxID=1810928 RepID=UPI003CCD6CE3